MMPQHWTEPYVGLPYANGGDDAPGFNCWSFFRHVELRQFGIRVPAFSQPAGPSKLVRKVRDGAVALGWEEVAVPRSGDAVLLAHWSHPSHVGVWVGDLRGGAVLHCVQGAGSVLHTRSHLQAARWRIVAFYRPVDLVDGAPDLGDADLEGADLGGAMAGAAAGLPSNARSG